jgi:hypothetical protein
MYNFENRAAQLASDPTLAFEKRNAETLNHFPVRYVTFADRRGKHPLPHRVILESVFRDSSVTTTWEVRAHAHGARMVRVTP